MFALHKQFRRNPKLYFFNDKELPAKGSNNESVVLPVLDCLCSPTAVTPHTNYFSMHKKKDCNDNAVCVMVTPSQKRLLDLLKGYEAADFADSLRKVHYNGTYGVPLDEYCPESSMYTHLLLDAIQGIADRHEISNIKKSN